MIERSNNYGSSVPGGQSQYRPQGDSDSRYDYKRHDHDDHGYKSDGYYGKKKKGFLGELFDF